MHLPNITMVFGYSVKQECVSWKNFQRYGRVEVVGSPRYDDIEFMEPSSDYVYFAPPVIIEEIPGMKDRPNPSAL